MQRRGSHPRAPTRRARLTRARALDFDSCVSGRGEVAANARPRMPLALPVRGEPQTLAWPVARRNKAGGSSQPVPEPRSRAVGLEPVPSPDHRGGRASRSARSAQGGRSSSNRMGEESVRNANARRSQQPHASIRGTAWGTVSGGVSFREQRRPAQGEAGGSGRDAFCPVSSDKAQTESSRSRSAVSACASLFVVT